MMKGDIMLDEKQLARIRELSQRKKTGKLTEAEAEERAELHQQYLQFFRQNMRQHIEGIKIVDKEGNDLTSDKVKEIREQRNQEESE